jgi:hypothetical protein
MTSTGGQFCLTLVLFIFEKIIFHNYPSFALKINQLKSQLKLQAKMRVEQDEVA